MRRVEVRRGVCRAVLLVGRWAVKVPTTRPYGHRSDRLWAWSRGVQANVSEGQWSGTEGVAPCRVHLGGLVSVMSRCAPVTLDEAAAAMRAHHGRWRPAILGGELDRDHPWWASVAPTMPVGDRKLANLGWLDGRIVWVDYDTSWNGCPHDPWNGRRLGWTA